MLNSADTPDTYAPEQDGFAVNPREVDNRTCVISLEGDIDLAAASTVRSTLVQLVREGHCQFVIDVSKVRHIDSTGLGVLVGLRKRLADRGLVAIANVPNHVRRLLQITGLDLRFKIFPTLDRALAYTRDSSARPPHPC